MMTDFQYWPAAPQGKKQKSQSKKDDLNRHNIATLVLWLGKPRTRKQRRKPN
jgi:hypothetical protein